jgi:predicted nucleic acid-binding Zn ribbon protein
MSEPEPELRGIDLARRALEEAKAAARASGKSVGQGRASPARTGRGGMRRGRGWSGARPDDRDPQLLGTLTGSIAKTRGWSGKVAEGMVFGRWPQVVGDDIALHATPVALAEGVLSITAESTAWATQLRLMQPQLLAKIGAAVGHGIVTSLRISGPTAPSWRKGERHFKGRGPRDTYG